MAKDQRKEVIREFLKESRANVLELEVKLRALQKALKGNKKIADSELAEMFQAVHTLKGTASLLGLKAIVDVSHQAGTLLRYLREHTIAPTKESAGLLQDVLKALKSLMADLKKNGREATDVKSCVDGVQAFLKSTTAPLKKVAQPKSAVKKRPLTWRRDIDEKYLEVYLDDTEQNIEAFNNDLVVLEKEPNNMALINNLFRVVHTIKGSSGMVNVAEVQDLAHAMENILSTVRDRKESFPEMFALLFKGIDAIASLVQALRHREGVSVDTGALVEELENYARTIAAAPGAGGEKKAVQTAFLKWEDVCAKAIATPQGQAALSEALAQHRRVYRITLGIATGIQMKSMKVLLVKERLGPNGEIIFMDPSPEAIDDQDKAALEIDILFGTMLQEKEIFILLAIGDVDVVRLEPVKSEDIEALLVPAAGGAAPNEEEVEEVKVNASAKALQMIGAAPQTPSIRIDAHKLDTLMNLSGELVTVRAQFERLVNLLNTEIMSQRDFMRVAANVKASCTLITRDLKVLAGPGEDPEMRRILSQLDHMTNVFGKLEDRAGQSNLAGEIVALDETTSSLGKIASDIQTAVMQARMVPIKGVFGRFTRIVRDIGKDLGKDVRLVLEGEETELDKNLVDSLREPLTHMVRNAIDHGIEDKATRKAAGKPERGILTLRAFHEGNNVCIEVGDDGKGLDPETLAKQALKRKLITEEQLKRFSSREKLDVMFLPGFSTAAQVTGLSGRGVGMDAVRNMIATLNGSIDVHSEIGKGTTFVLRIPLTLAIIQALLVTVAGETYALPLEAVTEIIKVTDEMISPINGMATVRLRDQVLSIVELRDAIQVRGGSRIVEGENFYRVVVITDGNSQVGIMVDEMVGESEIVIKPLSYHFFHVKGVSGVTILGDGQVALILDPKLIILGSR